MNKILIMLLLINITTALTAQVVQIPQQKIESKIENVTVFVNGGQVARSATASIPKGKSEVVFMGLTPNLDGKSLLVKGEGDFSIVSVKSQLNFLEETKRKDTIVVLETEKEKLATRLLRINAELVVLDRQEDLLSRNRVQVLGLLNNPSKVEDMKSLMDFQKTNLSEILTKKLDLEAELKKINQNLGKINNQITELNGRTSTTTAEVVVTVFAKTTAISDAKFRLEYIVPNCGWTPYYDLRVKDVISPIVTQMKAKVRQNSGEDWREVKLTLSTGEPNKGGVKPELGIWKIGWDGRSYYQGRVMSVLENYEESLKMGLKDKIQGIITDASGEPLAGASIVIKGTTKGTITDIEGKYTLDVLPNQRNSNLVVSYVGYMTEEVPVGNSVFSNVQLNEATLNEVVVVGYGTRDSYDSPTLPDTRSSASNSTKAEQMLQGKVSGVAIGSSPQIRIRGASSINRNSREAKEALKNYQEQINRIEIKENQKTTSTTFEIELPYTIPTDGKEYQVEIKEENIKAEYQYVCVPKLETDAFLTAQIVDWEQYNLLEGEANLYFEGTYMGKTLLKTNSVEDTLKLSLGRDKNVVVTRTKLKDFSKTSFLSSKIKASRGYEIKIRNKKSVPISIVMEDQIPIVSEKSIEIEYENKGAEYNKEQGKLTWKIDLKPLEDKKVNFNYTVKYPNTVNVELE
jgi:Domain of unknown function (DUF4139)/N-terminal domain of unknown function (DUF4140)